MVVLPEPRKVHHTQRSSPISAFEFFPSTLLGWLNGFIYDHPSHGMAILLLLRHVDPVRSSVNSNTVRHPLHQKVFKLSVVVSIIFLKNGDAAARTCGVDPPEARIEFHDIGALR